MHCSYSERKLTIALLVGLDYVDQIVCTGKWTGAINHRYLGGNVKKNGEHRGLNTSMVFRIVGVCIVVNSTSQPRSTCGSFVVAVFTSVFTSEVIPLEINNSPFSTHLLFS